jgi:hypothetical protein
MTIKPKGMRWPGEVAIRGNEKFIQNTFGKPEVKRQRWKPRLRWEDNTKMTL